MSKFSNFFSVFITAYHILVTKLRIISGQGVSIIRQTATPLKSLDYFRQYFVTAEKVAVRKDAETLFLFRVFFLLMAYCALLIGLLFPFVSLRPASRAVLADFVHFIYRDGQFYFIISCLLAYTLFLYWAVYFRPANRKLNGLIRRALHSESVANLSILRRSRWSGHRGLNFRQLILLTINGLQIFTFTLSFSLPFTMQVMGKAFLSSFPLPSLGTSSAATYITQLLWTLLLYLVHLFHTLLYFFFWYAFVYIVIHLAVYFTVVLTYAVLQFRANYAGLRLALGKTSKTKSRRRVRHLLSLQLRQNLVNFGLVFLIDDFFGLLFTVYMFLHMPLTAYFIMRMLFSQVGMLSFLAMIGIVVEACLGSLFLHLCLAFFCDYIHRGGAMLLRYSAASTSASSGSSRGQKMSVRDRLLLLSHIHRLVVRNKYGVTFSGN